MALAMVSIRAVQLSKNPVDTGESFTVTVEVFAFEAEIPQRRLPTRLGKRKELRECR